MTRTMTCALCRNSGPVALKFEEAKKNTGAVIQLQGVAQFHVHLACARVLSSLITPPAIDVGPFRYRARGRL